MSLCENHSCSGGVLTAATRTAFTSTRASSAGNNPLQDIDDSPSSGVEDQNIGSQHASSTVTISRQGRQLSLKVKRERRQSLLQARRQRAIALEVLFETGRKIPSPFCQSGRQTLKMRAIIGSDNTCLMRPKGDPLPPLMTMPVFPALALSCPGNRRSGVAKPQRSQENRHDPQQT